MSQPSQNDDAESELVPRVVSFIATAPDTQQAALVANVGWMLAGAGARVLVLDWQSERLAVESYLSRCPARPLDMGLLGETVSRALRETFPHVAEPVRGTTRLWPVGQWWRHRMDGLTGSLDVAALNESAPGGDHAPHLSTAKMQKLCRILKQGCPYHYVLLHGPAQRSDGRVDAAGVDVSAGVADSVVVSVLPGLQSITDARKLITDLRSDSHHGPNAVVVVTGGGSASVGDGGATARRTLTGRSTGGSEAADGTLDLVELPYDPDTTTTKVLAVLLDGDGELGRVYHGIAKLVADRFEVPQLPLQLRDHYAWALDRPGRTTPPRHELAYAPRDRVWTEKIATWLRAARVPVHRFPLASGTAADPDREDIVLAILSEHLAADDPRVPADAVCLGLPGADLDPKALAGRRWIDLSAVSSDGHRATVLGGLGLFDNSRAENHGNSAEDRSVSVSGAEITRRIPIRDPRFVGRGELLEAIREKFVPLAGPSDAISSQPVVLVGEPGVGKSGLANEYAHRFAEDYAGVWWVAAQDLRSVRGALAELTSLQGWPAPQDPADAALERLRNTPWEQRWLLVFDNVVKGVLDELTLNGVTDVIVTATDGSCPESGRRLKVEQLGRQESWEILRQDEIGVPGLTDEEAATVVADIGGLPLPLTIAAACLRDTARKLKPESIKHVGESSAGRSNVPAEEARRTAVHNLHEALSAARPNTVSVMSRILDAACEALSATGVGRLAVTLAEMCVFLSSDGIGLTLIRSRAMTAQLAAEAGPVGELLHQDEWELDRILAAGARFGLFDVDWGMQASLRMHRVLQRGMHERLKEEDREARQAAVLRALAELAPLRTSSPKAMADLAELQRHFEVSGAPDADHTGIGKHLGQPNQPGSPAWAVRRWVVKQVSFISRTGERDGWKRALELATRVESRWKARFGRDDPLRRRLLDQRGNLLFKLGRHEDARAVDEEVLGDLRRSLGVAHPRTLHSAGGLAGDLRHLGHFEEAFIEALHVWSQFCETFGQDHPDTLAEGNNLAILQFLTGRHAEALQLQRSCHAHRARVLGEEQPGYLGSLRKLGTYLCETGFYEEAVKHLTEAGDRRAQVQSPNDDPEDLLVARALTVTYRRAGNRSAETTLNEGKRLLGIHRERLGSSHPCTLAAQMSHAVELHQHGSSHAAVLEARECLPRLEQRYGKAHPFIGIARTNLATFERADGQTGRALRSGRQAINELSTNVDENHPWVLAATSNHARTLATDESTAEALDLVRRVQPTCLDVLGEHHPVTRAATANLRAAETQSIDPAATPRWCDLDIDIPLI